MISIKARGTEKGKWRIHITDEEWEVEGQDRLKGILEQLIAYKDDFGRINKALK